MSSVSNELSDWRNHWRELLYADIREQAASLGLLDDAFTERSLQSKVARMLEELEKDFVPWFAPSGLTRGKYSIDFLKKRNFPDPASVCTIDIKCTFLDDLK